MSLGEPMANRLVLSVDKAHDTASFSSGAVGTDVESVYSSGMDLSSQSTSEPSYSTSSSVNEPSKCTSSSCEAETESEDSASSTQFVTSQERSDGSDGEVSLSDESDGDLSELMTKLDVSNVEAITRDKSSSFPDWAVRQTSRRYQKTLKGSEVPRASTPCPKQAKSKPALQRKCKAPVERKAVRGLDGKPILIYKEVSHRKPATAKPISLTLEPCGRNSTVTGEFYQGHRCPSMARRRRPSG